MMAAPSHCRQACIGDLGAQSAQAHRSCVRQWRAGKAKSPCPFIDTGTARRTRPWRPEPGGRGSDMGRAPRSPPAIAEIDILMDMSLIEVDQTLDRARLPNRGVCPEESLALFGVGAAEASGAFSTTGPAGSRRRGGSHGNRRGEPSPSRIPQAPQRPRGLSAPLAEDWRLAAGGAHDLHAEGGGDSGQRGAAAGALYLTPRALLIIGVKPTHHGLRMTPGAFSHLRRASTPGDVMKGEKPLTAPGDVASRACWRNSATVWPQRSWPTRNIGLNQIAVGKPRYGISAAEARSEPSFNWMRFRPAQPVFPALPSIRVTANSEMSLASFKINHEGIRDGSKSLCAARLTRFHAAERGPTVRAPLSPAPADLIAWGKLPLRRRPRRVVFLRQQTQVVTMSSNRSSVSRASS